MYHIILHLRSSNNILLPTMTISPLIARACRILSLESKRQIVYNTGLNITH